MDRIQEYADQWSVSSKYFYDQGYYKWMCEKLNDHKVVFEVGCGTGYSTLSLLESGHKVIATDKNAVCIQKAKELMRKHNFTIAEAIEEFKTADVYFLETDVVIESFYENILPSLFFDVVICWNAGSYWDVEMIQFYLKYMLSYGLTIDQIKANPESSYSELILWHTCNLANKKNASIHIIDRGDELIDEHNDPYYCTLQTDFGYQKIEYDNLAAKSISAGGRVLVTNGVVNKESVVDVIFLSVLIA